MWEYTGGIGPPCGNGVLGLAGKIGCSGTHIDSKPNASAARQKSAGLAVSSVNGISSPIFMLSSPCIYQMKDAIERCAQGRFLSKSSHECQPVTPIRTPIGIHASKIGGPRAQNL